MPKLPINYENACIYEIVCKDVNITERYVGSTTNLIKRRYAHKTSCHNEKSKQYNTFVYQFIRANGSFDNWDVVLIEQVIDCKDKQNLHKRERHYIESLKAELNKYIPLRTYKEWNTEYRQLNKLKIAEQTKEYGQLNKEKISEYRQEHAQLNKLKIAEQKKEYRQLNNLKIAEQKKEYRQSNKEKIQEKNKEYGQLNKLKIAEQKKEYRQFNKEKIQEKKRNMI
jgi:hypothetical protein